MPRTRPMSLGGSAAVAGKWSDARLQQARPVPVKVAPVTSCARAHELQLTELHDRTGWHLAALNADGVEVGRLVQLPRRWMWAVKHGPAGYAASRAQALQALAVAWSER